jgi:hypothetical protein
MRMVLVGCAKGHRQIQWGAAFIIGVTLGLVGAAVAAGFYYLLGGVGQLTKLDG